MARDLGWTLEDFERCWAELYSEGMVKRDDSTGLVWLINSVKHDPPMNLDQVYGPQNGWLVQAQDLPECPLRDEAMKSWEPYISSLSDKKRRRSFSVSDSVSVSVSDPVPVSDPVSVSGGGDGGSHGGCQGGDHGGASDPPALMPDSRPMGEERDLLLEVCAEYGLTWGKTPPDLPAGDHQRRFLAALRDPSGGLRVLKQAVHGHHARASREGSKTGKELRHVVPVATRFGNPQPQVPDMTRVLEYAALGGGKADKPWTGR
jgi:hypothetical protein